jgi:hypothetical protein
MKAVSQVGVHIEQKMDCTCTRGIKICFARHVDSAMRSECENSDPLLACILIHNPASSPTW